MPQGKLGLVLLLSSSDSKDCCAMNFERTLFRSGKVVELAKKNLVPYRLDRDQGTAQDLYKQFQLSDKKPALLLIDADQDLLYKTQKCAEPNDCLKAMETALKTSKAKLAYSEAVKGKLAEIKKSMEKQDFKSAIAALSKIKAEALILSMRHEVQHNWKALEEEGQGRLDVAKEREGAKDFDGAFKIYQEVKGQFGRLKKIYKLAEDGFNRALKMKQVALK